MPGNRRKTGAASFEELNKMAAERMDSEKGGAAVGGLESMMGDLEGMDLGALMKDLDPNTLQELVQEGMKDPAIQEMVRHYLLNIHEQLIVCYFSDYTQCDEFIAPKNKHIFSSLECREQWRN